MHPEPDYLRADADLYEEHAKVCACFHCKPDDHVPMPKVWRSLEPGDYDIKEGWLFE